MRLLPLLACALLALPARADEALAMLQRIAEVSRTLTYSGTVMYRSGQRVDVSRIVHAVKDGVELERVEALDGSPREVLRAGG